MRISYCSRECQKKDWKSQRGSAVLRSLELLSTLHSLAMCARCNHLWDYSYDVVQVASVGVHNSLYVEWVSLLLSNMLMKLMLMSR